MSQNTGTAKLSNLAALAPLVVFAVNVVLLAVAITISGSEPAWGAVLVVLAAALGVAQLVVVSRAPAAGELLMFLSAGAMILGVGPLILMLPHLLGW